MKRWFIVLVSILSICSVTTAQAYFMIADPKSSNGAARVKVPVYNNSGSALDTGDVVIWDVGSSTGDNDLYVTTTTTANTGLVAGVVDSAIGAASVGFIVTYGFAECDIANTVLNGTLICTGITAGSGRPCVDTSQAYAIANATIASAGQGNCFVIKNK